MSETPLKKQKMSNTKVIGTHNGTFHCDEALAVFLLRQTAAYSGADVMRTRDQSKLDTCDIVVDVGAVYDAEKQRYDHHQRGFTEVFGYGYTTKLSSAGLVYKHFGKEVICNKLQLDASDPKLNTLWLKIYAEFIEAIDGIDNGVSQYPADLTPKYRSRTDLSSRVGYLNPAWNEFVDSVKVDSLFEKASALTGEEFMDRVTYYGGSWLPGREIVRAALEKRKEVDASGRIILFEQYAPWREHLYELEKELNIQTDVQAWYVVYPDETADTWRVQAVSLSPDTFENRKSMPQAWRGVRDDALSELSGIPGCVFVHASGFIGGNKTQDGAMQMARASVAMPE